MYLASGFCLFGDISRCHIRMTGIIMLWWCKIFLYYCLVSIIGCQLKSVTNEVIYLKHSFSHSDISDSFCRRGFHISDTKINHPCRYIKWLEYDGNIFRYCQVYFNHGASTLIRSQCTSFHIAIFRDCLFTNDITLCHIKIMEWLLWLQENSCAIARCISIPQVKLGSICNQWIWVGDSKHLWLFKCLH